MLFVGKSGLCSVTCSLFLLEDHWEKIVVNLDLFCSLYISWPLYYVVTRSFFFSLVDCIPLSYAHMHNTSRLLETIRLSFSPTSSIFFYVILIFSCLWMVLSVSFYEFPDDFSFSSLCKDYRTRSN